MKLPEIFKNKLDNNIDNNKKIFMGEVNNENEKDLLSKLPVKIKIKTKTGEETTSIIVGKTKNYLITKNRNVIYIKDIEEMKKA